MLLEAQVKKLTVGSAKFVHLLNNKDRIDVIIIIVIAFIDNRNPFTKQFYKFQYYN